MLSEIDERQGLIKTSWSKIRARVISVEPRFARIVDELSPDNSFVLYLAYYPYGAIKGDTQSTFLPKADGGLYRLSDEKAPKSMRDELGYGNGSAPLAMLLEKNLELFADIPTENLTLPRLLYQPGSIFPFARILSKKSNRTYAPNGILTLSSGARSTFMLANIGCNVNHTILQRNFNVQSPAPKNMHEHWHVFKEIVSSKIVKSDWKSCLLYFGHKWIDKIHSDASWLPLKLYLHELAWNHYEYQRNRFYYDLAISLIQQKRNLKPNPYLADTANHLFSIAIGASPGYRPAINDDALPLKTLQQAYIESYGLKKYCPIIFQPAHFNYETDKSPIYYSLQHPSTPVFSPKSRKVSSTLTEIRELHHLMSIYAKELASETNICSDTILSKVAANIKFSYFHNKPDLHGIIRKSGEMPLTDSNFSEVMHFPMDAPFVRGCVSIAKN